MKDSPLKSSCFSIGVWRLLIPILFLAVSCRGTSGGVEGQTDKEVGTARKLILLPDMVINEVAKGNARQLVDEQGAAEEAPGGTPATSWSVKVREGKVEWFLPANAVIDLGREHIISGIHLYDGDGLAGNVHINYGIPFRWTRLLTDPMAGSNVWQKHQTGNIRTRYIQISKETDADLREVILYGYPIGPAPEPEVAAVKSAQPLLENAIGINSHYFDPMDKVKVAGIVREYHNWYYNEGAFTQGYPGYPHNQIQFSPGSIRANNPKNKVSIWNPNQPDGIDFDKYYREMKEASILVFTCIESTVPWLNGEPDKRSSGKPVPEGADPGNPASYAAHADFLYQYAARYGSTKVADSKLKLAPNQERKSGLGYLEYFENWNEQDRWWSGRSDYFSPYEYAAMSSADYDGHESTMGTDKGIKNADPNAKLVMSGVALPNPDYMRAMKFWFEHNRKDRKFVFDVLTVHHYCNESGGQAEMRTGISPEQDGMRELMHEVVKFRNKHAPEKEVWMTEFGWDTNPVTPQAAPSKEMQGQWLVRGFLECLAAGMDRVAMYVLQDSDPNSKVQFSSTGLIGPKGNHEPKPSWYYVYTLHNQLSGMVYHNDGKASGSNVKIYKFKEPNSSRGVYVLWSPTSKGTKVNGYKLTLDGTPSTATLVTMKIGEQNGIPKKLAISGGAVQVDVSELPVFVQVDRIP